MINHRVTATAPVWAIDLDGTLADYYEHFRWFAELYLQRPVVTVWTDEMEGNFDEALEIDKHTYRDIKLAYRQGGMKRSIPPFSSVHDLITSIRARDEQVWICTTRPWLRLDNIDPDTRFWIQRNLGRVDGLIYGEDKYEDLIDHVGKERIRGVFDDLPENFERAQELGLHPILRSGAHNEWWRRKRPQAALAHSTADMWAAIKEVQKVKR